MSNDRLTRKSKQYPTEHKPKQKRLSRYSPALKFVHLLREKKCYSLYAATEQVDHLEFNLVCSPIDAKPSLDCLNELNPSTDHLRMAVWVDQLYFASA